MKSSFVKIATNDEAIEKFLTLEQNFGFKNIAVNYSDGTGYLYNYGTLIAKRRGNIVMIESKFYSNTTSRIQNAIRNSAKNKGYKIIDTEFLQNGGTIVHREEVESELGKINQNNFNYKKNTYQKRFLSPYYKKQ